MKSRIFRYIAFLCAVSAALSCLTFGSAETEDPAGKMAAMYAYTLNDYLFTYGSLYTENPGDSFYYEEDGAYPNGVIYSEIVNFDADKEPYLLIFLADSEYSVGSCHIWKYDEQKERSERIAILDVNYMKLADGQVGSFSMGTSNNKRYLIYRVYENDTPVIANYYTAVDGDAFKYIVPPAVYSEIGVMDFSNRYFHSNVDISGFNKSISQFFDRLKNTAADSVTYPDIAERLQDEDEAHIEAVLKTVTGLNNFDIADYKTMDAYREALSIKPNGDRFYLISEVYDLGDEIYYVRFSTDRSYYNYALLRRSDDAENGYQILKVRTDCIPLSDRELKQIKTDYDRNTLLYKKTKGRLKLLKPGETDNSGAEKEQKKPLISVDKILDRDAKLPIVCIGGGVALALLTILWVYLLSDND